MLGSSRLLPPRLQHRAACIVPSPIRPNPSAPLGSGSARPPTSLILQGIDGADARRKAIRVLRLGLLSCSAAVLIAGVAVPAEAQTWMFGRPASSQMWMFGRPAPMFSRPAPVKPRKRDEPRVDFGDIPNGPLQIVVSIGSQRVTLYSNGVQVAQGSVSTGVPDRPTPTGVFSIIQKDRYHHSNLYSNAPMPFMHRITWSGVALHEGPLPGFPASHGCIRLSHDFAIRLWRVSRLGARVIIARDDVTPVEFSHRQLLAFSAKAKEPPVATGDPEKRAQAPDRTRLAQAVIVVDDSSPRKTTSAPETVPNVTGKPGRATSPEHQPDGTPTEERRRAAAKSGMSPIAETAEDVPNREFQHTGSTGAIVEHSADSSVPRGPEPLMPAAVDPDRQQLEFDDPEKPAVPANKSAEQPHKRSGHLAIFVSRKAKRLFVRQGFEPLFDMPIEIDEADRPLGTHVFTALVSKVTAGEIRWNALSMPPELPRAVARTIGSKKESGRIRRDGDVYPVIAADSNTPSTASQALDRIHIPAEALDRIGDIVIPGSSLIISDQGLGEETGRGTDFIVVTR
jgi:lipoprotein-anchoring transpeptidase ErfK/SrfK